MHKTKFIVGDIVDFTPLPSRKIDDQGGIRKIVAIENGNLLLKDWDSLILASEKECTLRIREGSKKNE